jgi:low temperature requirement protein LtrA
VTPLELLFDLTFVAAVAQLTGPLAHAVTDGHAREATAPFLMVFFAIWWAWMNFTWFASAYDCDDAGYRLATFVQMGGVVVLAAGVGPAFQDGDYRAVLCGYVVMRLGLATLWVRAALSNPTGRATAARYAVGILVLQALWVGRYLLDERAAVLTYAFLVVLELCGPPWAQRRGPTSWHPHHIAERYALFTIIMLGEGVFAATSAVAAVLDDAAGPHLVAVSGAGLAVVAALWWHYFGDAAGPGLAERRTWSYVWGYGHYALYAALSLLGAGLEVVVDTSVGHGQVDAVVVVASIALPVAVVVVMIDLLRVPPPGRWPHVRGETLGALVVLTAIVALADRVGATFGVVLVGLTTVLAVLAGRSAARDAWSRPRSHHAPTTRRPRRLRGAPPVPEARRSKHDGNKADARSRRCPDEGRGGRTWR